MWTLRKSKINCNKPDKALLKRLFKYSHTDETAYKLQNDLTKIFDTQTSIRYGKRRLKNWIVRVSISTITCYNKFISTLESYFE